MPSGLAALLDDVAVIAKLAAASVDDIGAAAGRAGMKTAGVVVDDTAVTPRYVAGFTPERELPVIARIAKGSIINKLFIILPVALLLSEFLPFLIAPILMVGGAYLAFEGAEKVWELVSEPKHDLAEDVAELGTPEHERAMVKGAIRTDFILSAEIMIIALNEVAAETLWIRAATLIVVALVITAGVYGTVGLIVKLDDIGLHLAQKSGAAAQRLGRGLVAAMPKVLAVLSTVGIAAMMWVGGQILLHQLETFGIDGPLHLVEDIGHAIAPGIPALEWLVEAALAGLFGLAVGAVIVAVHHRFAPGH